MRDTGTTRKPALCPVSQSASDYPVPYRPEIDGLRAVAVASVALSHAKFAWFRGGFVGVDVFFVISGYLITSIILSGLQADRFNFSNFYEKRARRLLPALFLIMAVSSFFAYVWMLPDDLEKFGKSLIATSLFSNNIETLRTSGYWSLAADFRPLLHTWSLAIEGQFYILYPVAMIAAWKLLNNKVIWLFWAAAAASLIVAQSMMSGAPMYAFFLLPTRVWEFLVGGIVALHLMPSSKRLASDSHRTTYAVIEQTLSALGLVMIVLAVLCFTPPLSSPGLHTLVPTCGTALILVFSSERTLAFRLLSTRLLAGFGLISYSFYLWHVPALAFVRIYRVGPPDPVLMGVVLVLTVPVAWASWRLVEQPFRSRAMLSGNVGLLAGVLLSCTFISWGAYLAITHGAPARMGDGEQASGNDFHVAYNARVFSLKKDSFVTSRSVRMLVIGNSFARDFINMTVETFDLKHVDIVYRDDYGDCISSWDNLKENQLFVSANMIVIAGRGMDYSCINANLSLAALNKKMIFYVDTKHFGANLNWVMRLDPIQRRDQFNPMLRSYIDEEQRTAASIPPGNYVSLLAAIMRGDTVPITDENGRLISPDRRHVTRDGAIYIGKRALLNSDYGRFLKAF